MRPLLSIASHSTAIVGAAAGVIVLSGMLLGVEAATVAVVILTISAGALFGEETRR